MNREQLERMKNGKGFIAALDQSGGSTVKALKQYGIDESMYSTEEEMADLVHQMRTRVIKSPSFNKNRVLAAILFENTMDRQIDGMDTADYLWKVKGIVPLLKVDQGWPAAENGVQLMNPLTRLDELLEKAKAKHIFGTKMRSVIKEYNEDGIRAVVDQQFAMAARICAADLVPILEPEVDINCPDKEKAEKLLKEEIFKHLHALPEDTKLMFKLTIPTEENFYQDLIRDPRVVRVVALSGGYSQALANEKLARNHGMIASFSRAFLVGLNAQQSDEEFDTILKSSADAIYEASIA